MNQKKMRLWKSNLLGEENCNCGLCDEKVMEFGEEFFLLNFFHFKYCYYSDQTFGELMCLF